MGKCEKQQPSDRQDGRGISKKICKTAYSTARGGLTKSKESQLYHSHMLSDHMLSVQQEHFHGDTTVEELLESTPFQQALEILCPSLAKRVLEAESLPVAFTELLHDELYAWTGGDNVAHLLSKLDRASRSC